MSVHRPLLALAAVALLAATAALAALPWEGAARAPQPPAAADRGSAGDALGGGPGGASAPLAADAADAAGSVYFEPNLGQAAADVLFIARGQGWSAEITADTLRLGAGHVRFPGAGTPLPGSLLPGVSHHYRGDASQWRTNVPHYADLRLAHVAPGVEVVLHAGAGHLEFDFVLAPGADPANAWFDAVAGEVLLDAGWLVLATDGREDRLAPPAAYQDLAGGRVPVDVAFRLDGSRVSHELGPFDPTAVLVIDPQVNWGSYMGGTSTDYIRGIAASPLPGEERVAYVTAYAISGTTFPTTPSADPAPVFPAPIGSYDVAVARIDTAQVGAASLDWVAFLGSTSTDYAYAIDATEAGVFVTGYTAWLATATAGTPFPTTPNAYSTTPFNGGDVFLSRLSLDGSKLLYSTYLGGSSNDYGFDVDADAAGVAAVAGYSYWTTSTAPMPTPNAFQPLPGSSSNNAAGYDALVAKFDTAAEGAASLAFNSHLGGKGPDYGTAVQLAGDGSVWVAGYTTYAPPTASPNPSVPNPYPDVPFPARSDSLHPANKGGIDMFVAQFPPNGGAGLAELPFATHVGGTSTDYAWALGLSGGHVYVGGSSASTNLPTTAGAYQTCKQLTTSGLACQSATTSYYSGYVAKLDPTKTGAAQLAAATYMGSYQTYEGVKDIAFDLSGNVVVAGSTSAGYLYNFGTTPQFLGAGSTSATDGFVLKLDAGLAGTGTLNKPLWRGLMGGTGTDAEGYSSKGGPSIATNSLGEILYGSMSSSTNVAWANGGPGFQPTKAGSSFTYDGLVARIGKAPPVFLPPFTTSQCRINGLTSSAVSPVSVYRVTPAVFSLPTVQGYTGAFPTDAPVDEDTYTWWTAWPDPASQAEDGDGQTTWTGEFPADYTPGVYNVHVQVKDDSGVAPDTASTDCWVQVKNKPPTAVITGPTSVALGGTVVLDAGLGQPTGTRDPDGTIAKLQWNVNDLSGLSCVDPLTNSPSFAGQKLACTFSQGGSRTFTLTATDNDGTSCMSDYLGVNLADCTSSPTQHVVNVPMTTGIPPTAQFVYSMPDPAGDGTLGPGAIYTCGGPVLVDFQSTSYANPGGAPLAGFAWDTNGDGVAEATGPGATLSLPGAGQFAVTLKATDQANLFAMATGTVAVLHQAPPQAAIAETSGLGSPYPPGVPLAFEDRSILTGAPLETRTWKVDGQVHEAGSAFSLAFPPGTHTVELAVADAKACASATSLTFSVAALPEPEPSEMGAVANPLAPQAMFAIRPADALVDEVVRFEDLSLPGAAPIAALTWDFGDGTGAETVGKPTHRYSDPGAYEVRLRVRDLAGLEAEAVQVLEVATPAQRELARAVRPIADAGLPSTARGGEPVTLDGRLSEGQGLRFDWQQVDGPAVSLRGAGTPQPTFDAPVLAGDAVEATLVFRLTVTDGVQASLPDQVTVRVLPAEAPTFLWSAHGEVLEVQATAGVTNATWDFGDGTTAYGLTAQHIYAVPGTYVVRMEAATAAGMTTAQIPVDIAASNARAASQQADGDDGPRVLGMRLELALAVFLVVAATMGVVLGAFNARR